MFDFVVGWSICVWRRNIILFVVFLFVVFLLVLVGGLEIVEVASALDLFFLVLILFGVMGVAGLVVVVIFV